MLGEMLGKKLGKSLGERLGEMLGEMLGMGESLKCYVRVKGWLGGWVTMSV